MNSVQLFVVRLGSWAADFAQSLVATLGGGNGDPMRLQESMRSRNVKPKKKAGRGRKAR